MLCLFSHKGASQFLSPAARAELNTARRLKTVRCVRFSFGKGDVFVVQNEMEDGWLWVTSERTKESGLVPAPFVKDLVCVMCGCWGRGRSRGVQRGCRFGG